MSRFGPVDLFYVAIRDGIAREFNERLAKADAERYRRQMAARPLRPSIIDRDPGDEDCA